MSTIALFEQKQVRRVWNQAEAKWYFAIVDVVAVLTDSNNPQVYWRVMKKRLTDEGSETVTKCNALKMTAADGKQRLTDVANTEQLLRLIQSIPSPKAEPFKLWLARAGHERLEEIENPELAATRMREIYRQKGYSDEWIEKRVRGIAVRDIISLPTGTLSFTTDAVRLAAAVCIPLYWRDRYALFRAVSLPQAD